MMQQSDWRIRENANEEMTETGIGEPLKLMDDGK
jgi:hypothetical protein